MQYADQKGVCRMKSKVKYVALNRAEGPIEKCVAVVFYVGEKPDVHGCNNHFDGATFIKVAEEVIVDDVQAKLRDWGESAPEKRRGYDKVDFFVMWQNGLEYEGRFDLQKGGMDAGESFWQSLKGRLGVFSCRVRPKHFKDADWDHYQRQMKVNGAVEACGGILDRCEV